MMMTLDLDTIVCASAIAYLQTLPDNSVHCCVTSVPYYSLRSYLPAGHPDKASEIGCEATLPEYIDHLVAVFKEIKRVLRKDGTVWLNAGDSYVGYKGENYNRTGRRGTGEKTSVPAAHNLGTPQTVGFKLKNKDLMGVPWRLALALQDIGYYLRCDIIWNKPNISPESPTDRPTRTHEYIFLLTKHDRYEYDIEAVREESGRNHRSVWTVSTEQNHHLHTAVFPRKLIEPMIRAGCPVGGTVIDPFMGSGTTARAAVALGRHYLGCDISQSYVDMALDSLRKPFESRTIKTNDQALSELPFFDSIESAE